jgi:hypothetical protein
MPNTDFFPGVFVPPILIVSIKLFSGAKILQMGSPGIRPQGHSNVSNNNFFCSELESIFHDITTVHISKC